MSESQTIKGAEHERIILKPSKILALDFDGTVVTHAYPAIGRDIGALRYLRALVDDHDVRIILWTMRSGRELGDALAYLEGQGVSVWACNNNPEQGSWSQSPKAYANRYLDDAAHGCPLKNDPLLSDRPFVDWAVAGPQLIAWGKGEV